MVTQPAFSIAPALYSGVKIWSYFSNGYAESNSRSKNSKPIFVSSRMLSVSTYSTSERRAYNPSSTGPRRLWTVSVTPT